MLRQNGGDVAGEAWTRSLPRRWPREEVFRHLEQAFGEGDAAQAMRQLAQEYQQNYEPLRETLNQFVDVIGDRPAHEALSSLLERERALRSNNPDAIKELAETYGYTPSQAEHVTKLETELSEYRQRESQRAFEEFARDRPYLNDPQLQSALASEMRQLQQQTPGLKGTALLRLAADNLAERTGISRQLQQQQVQEMRQYIEARDAEWQQILAEREAEYAKREAENRERLQREAEEKTRQAKRAASVNLKGSPGHNSNKGSFANVDAELREIWNRNN